MFVVSVTLRYCLFGYVLAKLRGYSGILLAIRGCYFLSGVDPGTPRVYIYIAEKHASPKKHASQRQRKRSRYSQHRLAGVGCVCAGDEMQGRDEVCKRGDARCDEGIPFCPTYRYYTSSE